MPTRLTCLETFGRLDDYLDRELSREELAEVEQHLETCAMCTSEFALERELLEDVRGKLRRIRVPQDLMSRIAARLGASLDSG